MKLFLFLLLLFSNITLADSLKELKVSKSPDLIFSSGDQYKTDNLFEKSELMWELGYAQKAYQSYTQVLTQNRLLDILSDDKRMEVTHRYYQYETQKNIDHILKYEDPRLQKRVLSLQDKQDIQNKKDFSVKNNVTKTENDNIEVTEKNNSIENKKKTETRKEISIINEVKSNSILVLLVIGGFLSIILLLGVYWYMQSREEQELHHLKRDATLQKSIQKYEEILGWIATLEVKTKRQDSFNNFRYQASIKSLQEINNELYSLINTAKKNHTSDKDIERFVIELYQKAKSIYNTAFTKHK